ncbi:MAG: indolepyruvate oxidoreductase subunit beta family protein [SAR324 cluster bacterium]|nr:indolepyruvate oxidoreductase subunit beta family protein [SAR324 cluster bacterium]
MKNQENYRPITILIAAMGGEGGGVLMNWIVNTAWQKGYPVQATSIPGVAQRTGATTYYIELLPIKRQDLDGKTPVFTLNPAPGEIDLMLATELMEAVRAISNGFVTSRTTLIASNHRVFTTLEKMAAGDGRYEEEKLLKIVKNAGKRNILHNFSNIAKENGSIINAVFLGVLSGMDLLPLKSEDFERSIREEGKAVKTNLRGFQAGLALLKLTGSSSNESNPPSIRLSRETSFLFRIQNDFPERAQEAIKDGVDRLTDYQNASYAVKFLDRLEPFRNGSPDLCREVAKNLAVRMSYEDIIRVAQAKTRAARLERIRGEIEAGKEEPVMITEFFKPGIPEICDLLPPSLSTKILKWAEKTGREESTRFEMHVKTSTVFGFLKLKALEKLRWWRPRSFRWGLEQEQIEQWLRLIVEAMKKSDEFAIETARLARLIKGYGSTHKRGTEHYQRIVNEFVKPCLAGNISAKNPQVILKNLLNRSLANPEKNDLKSALAKIHATMPSANEN